MGGRYTLISFAKSIFAFTNAQLCVLVNEWVLILTCLICDAWASTDLKKQERSVPVILRIFRQKTERITYAIAFRSPLQPCESCSIKGLEGFLSCPVTQDKSCWTISLDKVSQCVTKSHSVAMKLSNIPTKQSFSLPWELPFISDDEVCALSFSGGRCRIRAVGVWYKTIHFHELKDSFRCFCQHHNPGY